MKSFINKKVVYIAIAAVFIAILAAVSASLSGGASGFSSLISEPFFKPLKSVTTSLVDSLEGVYDYMYRFDTIKAENEELKARISQLEEQYREQTEISAENDRLRALFDFSARHSNDNFDYEAVSVISWTASNYASSFTISKGSSSGIELYDCVITENGYLVGQVTEVGVSSGTVTTLLDSTMSVGATLYGTGDTGVIEGSFDLFRQGLLKLGYLNADADVVTGDTVVTSGEGGTCPVGLVIGYVSGLGDNPSGLDFHAIIEPAADINGASHLFVIKEFTSDD